MGFYSVLSIGRCTIRDWKAHVPLEPFLLFAPEDLYRGRLCDRNGHSHTVHAFKTTVADARKCLDMRGITIQFCQELFQDFRSDVRLDPSIKAVLGSRQITGLAFAEYMAVLRRQLSLRSYLGLVPPDEPPADVNEQKVAAGQVFDENLQLYFPDADFLLELRVLLEAAEPNDAVLLDLSELIETEILDPSDLSVLYDHVSNLMLRRLRLTYQLYGFVLQDPRVESRLRAVVAALTEDQLINTILLPLLARMGFERLRRVAFHGPGEFGSDVLPFRRRTPFGTLEYYALQAKAVPLRGGSRRAGNVASVLNQATTALAVSFVDDLDNERKRLDKFVIATNKEITPEARRFLEESLEGRRSLILLDIDRLAELLTEFDLAQYVLFSDLRR
jgi:hypothetical protein